MQINIFGLSAIAFFLFLSVSFLLILFVKTESQKA
uniref:Photosystem II protein M n=1 Tax=Boodleopsis sp. FL1161 TaxID=2364084 RepID=A0A386AZD2_9CHLO|nr:photosystem II protein M [Boodleopsis sp. FL1161]